MKTFYLSAWLLLVGLSLNTFAGPGQGDGEVVPNPLPAPTATGFRNTYYYLIDEWTYPRDNRTEEVRDLFGRVLTRVTKRFRRDLLMEGSGRLVDNRVLNYAGRVDGESRFAETVHIWGRGSGNCALVPFKTIAVDPTQLKPGSMVYIDETVGMEMPDGKLHNGIWYAEDTGGAILHDRIDLFIGLKKNEGLLDKAKITHLQPLTVRVLKEPAKDSCAQHSPK